MKGEYCSGGGERGGRRCTTHVDGQSGGSLMHRASMPFAPTAPASCPRGRGGVQGRWGGFAVAARATGRGLGVRETTEGLQAPLIVKVGLGCLGGSVAATVMRGPEEKLGAPQPLGGGGRRSTRVWRKCGFQVGDTYMGVGHLLDICLLQATAQDAGKGRISDEVLCGKRRCTSSHPIPIPIHT